ncbi:proton myo-inositol cotransporter-like [Gigantopelta aegis]|uniref:proton myo-inositol cotransporter-like n=1 Tax=Gigantopelta aegis TaxID=1735272 RepID=UPI001B889BE3|nr:proton myo-inositol cotransporter-like [Gigantopelta aegis]
MYQSVSTYPGITSMIVPVYIAESSPSAIRGRLVTLNQLFICIGILLSSIIAGLFSVYRETGWRYMLGLGALPALVQFVAFIFLPESPRWLLVKGRPDEARAVLERISRQDEVDASFSSIVESLKTDAERSSKSNVVTQICTTPYVRKALSIGCGLCIFAQFSGINTIIYYSGTIMKMAGFPVRHAIWLVCVPNAVVFVATFFGLWTVERFGRKPSLCFSIAGVILSLIVVAVGFQLSITDSPAVNTTVLEIYDNGTQITRCHLQYDMCESCIEDSGCGFCYDDLAHASCLPARDDLASSMGRCNSSDESSRYTWSHGYCPNQYTWIPVLGMTLFVLAFAPGLGPMPWTVNAEIYPLWARGICMSVATACLWVSNLVVSMTFLTLTEKITPYGTFYMFAGISTLGLLFVFLLLPETKEKTLEEVQKLFMTNDEKRQIQDSKTTAESDTKM